MTLHYIQLKKYTIQKQLEIVYCPKQFLQQEVIHKYSTWVKT